MKITTTASETHVELGTPTQPKCDFCSRRPVIVCFKTTPAELMMPDEGRTVTLASDAHWGACADCEPLVVGRDRDGLYARCLELAPAEIRDSGTARFGMRLIQETMFWAGFRGEQHPAHDEHDATGWRAESPEEAT